MSANDSARCLFEAGDSTRSLDVLWSRLTTGMRVLGSFLKTRELGDCLVGNLGELLYSSNAEKNSGELNLVFLRMFLADLTAASAVVQCTRGLEKLGLM